MDVSERVGPNQLLGLVAQHVANALRDIGDCPVFVNQYHIVRGVVEQLPVAVVSRRPS